MIVDRVSRRTDDDAKANRIADKLVARLEAKGVLTTV